MNPCNDGLPQNSGDLCNSGTVMRESIADSTRDSEPTVFREVAKEIMFGCVAGMVSEVFEYPFDLAKVRLQAQLLMHAGGENHPPPKFRGPMDCLMQTWKQEGVRGLYRGLPAPIVGAMAETAALFVAYNSFQNLIRSVSTTNNDPHSPLTLPQLGFAAAGAGVVASFVLTPIELIKCKMQVQMMNFPLSHPTGPSIPGRIPHRTLPSSSLLSSVQSSDLRPPTQKGTNHIPPRSGLHDIACKADTSGSLHHARTSPPGALTLIRTIIDTHGVRGLWLGHTGTLFRETGGTAAWFMVKEYVAGSLVDRRLSVERTYANFNAKDTMPLAWESAVSGAVAGAVGALVLYPADTVKSAIQTEEEMSRGMRTKQPSPAGAANPSSSLSSIPRASFIKGEIPKKNRVGVGTARGGFWRTATKMYRVHGVKGLYAGCGMTVARAIPSSGIIFVVYDGLNRWFG